MRMPTAPILALALIAVAAVAAAVAILVLPGTEPPAADRRPTASASDVERPDGGNPAATDLRAVDPRPWARADWDPIVDVMGRPDPLFRIDGVVEVGGQVVAWGRMPIPGRNQFNDMGAVFVSADGRSWQAVPIDHGVNAASTSEIAGIAAGPSGYLAHGGVCCAPGGGAIWHSEDLLRWTRTDIVVDEPILGAPTLVTGGPDRWVAAASAADAGDEGRMFLLESADGVSWQVVLEAEGGFPGLTIADIAMTEDGPIAVGSVAGPDGTYDGAVWRSAAPGQWERIGADDPTLVGEGEESLRSVTPHAGGLFVAGVEATTEERRVCDAMAVAAPIEAGPPAPATSCAFGREFSWISADGVSWERVDPAQAAGVAPIEFRVMAAGGPELVLFGESSGPDSPDTNLFTSPDGRLWTMAEPSEPIGAGVAAGMVVRGREVIAIASESTPDHLQRYRAWLVTLR